MSEQTDQATEPMVTPDVQEKVENVYTAFRDFINEAPILTKSEEGYGYKYVHLAEIVEKIQPILHRHNLIVVQTLKGTGILTQLIHVPSETMIESYCDIPQNAPMKNMNIYQAYGSAITYFRRYQYATICGLVSDDDADAKAQKSGKPKLSSQKFKEAIEYFEKVEVTLEEIMAKYTLTQAQKQELITKK